MTFLTYKSLKTRIITWTEQLGVDPREGIYLEAPALIVVDMQNDFLVEDGLLKVWGGPAIIPNITELINAFHAAKRPVFFSRHIYQDPEVDGGATARKWGVDRNSSL